MDESPQSIRVVLRQALPQDKDFIMDAWLQSQYYSNPDYLGQIPTHLFFVLYTYFIKAILFKPDTCAWIATDVDHPSWIVGFSVYQGQSLYYVYVKKDYRKQGLAKLLVLPETKQVVTLTDYRCLTKIGLSLVEKYGLQVRSLEPQGEKNGKK